MYEDATENNRVKTVNIEDVPFLKENINQRRASFKSTSKNAVDYFSLIETQGILLVEKADGSKDYTFALKLPYQDTLTNLIAQEKNNVFTYSLLKYNAENQAAWLQGLKGPNPFALPVTVTQTDLEGKSLPSNLCIRASATCPSGDHTLENADGCVYSLNQWTYNLSYYECSGGGSDGSNSSDDSNSSSDGGNSSSSSTSGGDTTPNNGGGSTIGGGSNTSTSPKPCKTCDFNNIDDPCGKIKEKTSNPKYLIEFKNLNKPSIFDLPYESGFFEMPDLNPPKYVWGVHQNATSVKIPNLALNATHVHNNNPKVDEDGLSYDGTVKILSPKDVVELITTLQTNNGSTPQNTFISMVSSDAIYALTLLEQIPITTNMNLNSKEYEKMFILDAINILDDFRGTSPEQIDARNTQLKKLLFNYLKKMGIDNKVGLFQGEYDANENRIKWKKIKIDNNNNLIETPC